MKLHSVFFLVGLCNAFQYWKPSRQHRFATVSIELAVASKPPPGRGREENEKNDSWENFKRALYSGVDGASELTSKIVGVKENTEGGVSDGYGSFEKSVKKDLGPASKLISEFAARSSALGLDKEIESSSSKENPRTSFDSFKESLYSASEVFGTLSSAESESTPLAKLERSIPYRKSLAQELGVGTEIVEDLLSSNLVKRLKAQQDIREREAKQRAQARNEQVRAKKEDFYKIVDSLKAAVDAFPETMDKTEQAIKYTIKVAKDAPSQVGKVVDEVKAIPSSVKMKADETKQAISDTIDKTNKAVKEVVSIPDKLASKLQDTKEAVINTQKSIDQGVTSAKVFLRLEKPKPKPPKLPPPKPKTAKDIALSVAGTTAIGVGKVSWWAAKSVATAAWNGASSAIKERQSNLEKESGPLTSGTTEIGGPTFFRKQTKPEATQLPSALEKEAAELQKEVDEALRLADETLRKVDDK